MTLAEFCQRRISLDLSGLGSLALYSLLLRHEDELDDQQSQVLNRLRDELYQNFSIEQMEGLDRAYQSGGCVAHE